MITQETDDAFASILVDMARSAEIAPRMLPEPFGPDGRYLLEELVGIGHDSHVYRAVDRHLSKPTVPALVAIKVRASGASARVEALVGRSVVHDNVVRIIDHGITDDGEPYVVQEWIGGGDLTELPLPLDRRDAARLVGTIARGVQGLHSAGNVHGDLKPSNVLRTEEGVPKITDFDLASSPDLGQNSRGGNLAFMAPERLLDEHAPSSPLADIYALGGLLYYFVTGRLPHGGRAEEVLSRLHAGTPIALDGIERDLAKICARAMSPNPDDRYRSAEGLATDLESWLHKRPIAWTRPSPSRRFILLLRRRPLHVLVASLVLATLCTAAGWYQVSQQREIEARRRETELALAKVEANRVAYERKQATMRVAIRTFVNNLGSLLRDKESHSSVFMLLVFLDWISDVGVLGDEGPIIVRDARLEGLVELRKHLAETGQSGMLADSMAAFSLAMTHLEVGDYEAAEPYVSDAASGVFAILDEDDEFRRALEVVRTLIEFERSTEAGDVQTTEALREELEVRRNQALANSPKDEIAYLIRLAFERHPQ